MEAFPPALSCDIIVSYRSLSANRTLPATTRPDLVSVLLTSNTGIVHHQHDKDPSDALVYLR